MTQGTQKAEKKGWFSRFFKGEDTQEQTDETAENLESVAPEETQTEEPVLVETAAEELAPHSAATEIAAIEIKEETEEKTTATAPSLWRRLKERLFRSTSALSLGISRLLGNGLDDVALESLTDLLIAADIGIETSEKLVAGLKARKLPKDITEEALRTALAEEIAKILEPIEQPLPLHSAHKPHVILMVGVNGAGKTTTLGKLAMLAKKQKQRVILGAGDTFRAAAVQQLQVWGERTGATVITRPQGTDPASLAFDALTEAKDQGADLVMLDTAGRLQNKQALMSELEKVVRVIKKHDESAPHATLLVIDATTGQNAVQQAEIFAKTAGVTGLIVTKLDGSARGGVLVSIADRFKLPVHYIGIGEGIDDLVPFSAQDFAKALLGLEKD